MTELEIMGERAKKSARLLSGMAVSDKNRALSAVADVLEKRAHDIKEANKLDMEYAEKNALSRELLDRLLLNDKRINAMIEGIKQIAALNDPIGAVSGLTKFPNGLQISAEMLLPETPFLP